MKLPYIGTHNPILTKWQPTFQKTEYPPSSTVSPVGGSSRFKLQNSMPTLLQGSTWQARPLQMANAALTYEAYLTTPEAPCIHYGHNLPTEAYTWQDHLQQVKKAEQAHRTHTRFSFAILDKTTCKCLGCVHLAPLRPFLIRYNAPARLMIRASENTGMISSWLHPALKNDNDIEQELINRFHAWFNKEWALPDHYFMAATHNTKLIHNLNTANLEIHFEINVPTAVQKFLFFGA